MRVLKRILILCILLIIITQNLMRVSIFANDAEFLLGDIDLDGDVTVNDLAQLKLHLIDKQLIVEENRLHCADFDRDGKITINDLACLKLYLIYGENDDNEKIEVEDTSFRGFEFKQIEPQNSSVTFNRYNFQSKKQQKYDINGAGSQWPVSLDASDDGSIMLYGTDVAGLFISRDHGKTWTSSNRGLTSRGVNMFAIDPKNTNHILALGLSNKGINSGIYVSFDKANSWQKKDTEVLHVSGERYLWDGLEFDALSYNEEKNMSMDAYFSIPYKRDSERRKNPKDEPKNLSTLTPEQVGLYKSEDGGITFNLFINDEKLADGILKITDNGDIYIGNQYGLFLVNKETKSIAKSYLENDPSIDYSKGVTGLDCVGNTIYVQTWDGIFKLENGVLNKITNDNYKKDNWPQFVAVSKTNPNHIIYQYRSDVNNYYVNRVAISRDGGSTWIEASTNAETIFYDASWTAREKLFIIDGSNDNNVITFGSDTLLRSENGGDEFVQVSGISNMMQGGKFNFNYYDPDLILFSAQDYTGVVTKDGGKNFEELKVSGKGNMYGGFAADRSTFFGFASPSWGGGTLHVTHDAGDTWIDTLLAPKGAYSSTYYSSLQSISDPNCLFAVEYYSKDNGYTWNEMNGCTSVYTFNYEGAHELYGKNESGNPVVSFDNGDSWQILKSDFWSTNKNTVKEQILDMAYDHVNNYLFAIVKVEAKYHQTVSSTFETDEAYRLDLNTGETKKLDIPIDKVHGTMREKTIAVDPNSTSVVYIGGSGDYFASCTGLIRSLDSGETFQILTATTDERFESIATNSGGFEITNLRVNPYNGKVLIACGCYGYEIFDPPYDSSLLSHERPSEHTIKYVYNDKIVHEETVLNNQPHNYIYDEDGLTLVSWYLDKEFKNEFKNGSKIYNSMVLYAKMEKAINIKFYDGDILFRECDLDAYDRGSLEQIPKKSGYAFAGWYVDKGLTTVAKFENIKEDTELYAGWYKIEKDVFNIEDRDIGNSIAYSDHRIQDGKLVENDAVVVNRSVYLNVDKNSWYYVSFKMDTRCRIGLGLNTFWQYNAVKKYIIDDEDNNGRVPANKYVFKVVNTEEFNRMMVYYYTDSGSQEDYMNIKKTFKIYKIVSDSVVEN